MDPKSAACGILIVLLLMLSPGATAQTQTEKYGSFSGDENVRADGARCFDAIEGRDDVSCTVLYAHPFDLLNLLYINTQRPPDHLGELSRGYANAPGIEALWSGNNEFVLVSSPGFVEYGTHDPPQTSHVRGLGYDLDLAAEVDIWGHWYMSADFDEYGPLAIDRIPDGSPHGPGKDPSYGMMPCLTVRMALAEGRNPGGTVLAEGQVTKTIVTGMHLDDADDPAVPDHTCGTGDEAAVEIDDIIEFEVNMGPAKGPIDAAEGFNILVHWWNHAPGEPDDQDKVYMHQWNLRSGPEHMPRVAIPVMDAIRIDSMVPEFQDDMLFLQTEIISPWGAYDVDPGNIGVSIFDADGDPVAATHLEGPVLRYSGVHTHLTDPVRGVFSWDHQADGVPPGEYTLRVHALNWQWTGDATREVRVVIPEAHVEEGPDAGVAAAALGLLALIGLVRLRRSF